MVLPKTLLKMFTISPRKEHRPGVSENRVLMLNTYEGGSNSWRDFEFAS
jgi:hypothetical protein